MASATKAHVTMVGLIGLTVLQVPVWLFGLLHLLIAGAPSEQCTPGQIASDQCGPSPLAMLAFGLGALAISVGCTAVSWLSAARALPSLPTVARVALLLVPLVTVPALYVLII